MSKSKSGQKADKKSPLSHSKVDVDSTKVSQKQKIVELFKKGLEPTQVFRILETDRSYTYRLYREFRDTIPKNNLVHAERETCGQSGQVNNHAHMIVAYVYWMSDKYKKHPQQNFMEFIPDVDVHTKGKRIYITSRVRFKGINEEKAMLNSIHFYERVLLKLQDRLGIVIFKRGHVAWEFRREETETTNSVLSKNADSKGLIYKVHHPEDGKLRLTTDRSNGTNNHETHHQRDNHVDSITFNNHINSILDNPYAPTYAELLKLVKINQKQINEVTKDLHLTIKITNQNLELLRNSSKIKETSYTEEKQNLDYFG